MKSDINLTRVGKVFDSSSLGRGLEWKRNAANQQRRLAADLFFATTKVTNCPVCGTSKYTHFSKIYGYDYSECQFCSHVFCSSPIDEVSAKALYDGCSLFRSAQRQVYLDVSVLDERLAIVARPKVKFVCEVLDSQSHIGEGLWVDIGCGAGEVLVAARESGFQVRGVESDIEEAAFVRSLGIQIVNQLLDEGSMAEALSDANVVSILNVLEHIHDPIRFLQSIVDHCGSSFVVIEVPRHPSVSSLSNKLFPNLASRHIYPPEHLHIFSDSSIKRVLKACNLETVASWYFGQDAADFFMCANLSAPEPVVGPLWNQVMNSVPMLQAAIDRCGLSDTMFLVARKV